MAPASARRKTTPGATTTRPRRLALHLTALDPGNTEWQRDLSIYYERLGDMAVAQGRLDEAARAHGDALVIHKKLAAGDPGNTQWQRDLSYSLF